MALLRYLKPRDGLPDPRGALSLSMPSQAIAEANREVQEATSKAKREPYKRYSASVRAEIGKYASQHGVAATARVLQSNWTVLLVKSRCGQSGAPTSKEFTRSKGLKTMVRLLPFQ